MGPEPSSAEGAWHLRERAHVRPAFEIARLFRRARTRPLATAACALLAALMLVGLLVRRGETFTAEVIIRVSEGIIVKNEGTPLPREKLEGYLRSIAFSDENLTRVIERYDLFPIARARGIRFAIEELTSRIELSVYGNYFAVDHGLDVPRTVRIAVSYEADDSSLALPIARSVANLIIDAASERRQAESRALLAASTSQARALERGIDTLEAELAKTTAALLAAIAADKAREAARLRVEVVRLQDAREASALTLSHARKTLSALALRQAADARRLGLAFTIADERPPSVPARREVLILAGALAFAFALPLAAIGIGALDDRIHDQEDVIRLGLGALGAIPHVGARARRSRLYRSFR